MHCSSPITDSIFGIKLVYIRIICGLAAAFGALLIGEHVYLKEFLTTDENSYVFQSWLFLQGDLSQQAPAGVDSFFHRMVINDEKAGWLSRYPPAHSVWLMPGVAVDYPRLMVAVAAFLSVWFITLAGERLRIPLWITVGLLFASPYFWLMQGSVLSHTSGLAVTALMIWAYLAWLEDRKLNFLIFAGLAWSFLFLNRTYTAFLIAIPFGVHALIMLYRSRTLHNFIGTVVFAGCSLIGVGLFLFYNFLTTGDPFLPTYLYYNKTDGIGFGIRNKPDFNFTPQRGWEYIKFNLATLNVRLWGFWGSLIAWLVLTIVGWKGKGISLLMLSITLLIWLGYGAFWFKGIKEVAPVYYYESLIFIVLLAGLGLNRLINFNWRLPNWGLVVVSFAALVFVGQAAARTFYVHGTQIIGRNLEKGQYQSMIRAVPPNSIVLLSGFPPDILDETSWNPKGIESDPLVMRAGYGSRHLLHHYYSDRNIYHVHGRPPLPPKLLDDVDAEIPVLWAAKMLSRIGEKNKDARIAKEPDDAKGPLAFGIKQYFVPGTYEVKFFIKADGNKGEEVGVVEVIENRHKKQLAAKNLKPGDATVVFNIEIDKVTLIEPRVHFLGNGQLEFDRIEMRLLEHKVPNLQTAYNN